MKKLSRYSLCGFVAVCFVLLGGSFNAPRADPRPEFLHGDRIAELEAKSGLPDSERLALGKHHMFLCAECFSSRAFSKRVDIRLGGYRNWSDFSRYFPSSKAAIHPLEQVIVIENNKKRLE